MILVFKRCNSAVSAGVASAPFVVDSFSGRATGEACDAGSGCLVGAGFAAAGGTGGAVTGGTGEATAGVLPGNTLTGLAVAVFGARSGTIAGTGKCGSLRARCESRAELRAPTAAGSGQTWWAAVASLASALGSALAAEFAWPRWREPAPRGLLAVAAPSQSPPQESPDDDQSEIPLPPLPCRNVQHPLALPWDSVFDCL